VAAQLGVAPPACMRPRWSEEIIPMGRKKASDFPPEVLQLFDGYVHGAITIRHLDTTKPRLKLAWSRTITFFKENLAT
jgi:hypothetical protein